MGGLLIIQTCMDTEVWDSLLEIEPSESICCASSRYTAYLAALASLSLIPEPAILAKVVANLLSLV